MWWKSLWLMGEISGLLTHHIPPWSKSDKRSHHRDSHHHQINWWAKKFPCRKWSWTVNWLFVSVSSSGDLTSRGFVANKCSPPDWPLLACVGTTIIETRLTFICQVKILFSGQMLFLRHFLFTVSTPALWHCTLLWPAGVSLSSSVMNHLQSLFIFISTFSKSSTVTV